MRTLIITLLLSLSALAGGKESTIAVCMESTNESGSGTGVCIANDGKGKSLILTNRHVLDKATKCWGVVGGALSTGTVLFVNDGVDDLAAMEIDVLVPKITLAPGDPVAGTSVSHYGRMSGPQKGMMKGAVELTYGDGRKVTELLSDLLSIPGDSGAGLFDAQDQLVALNTGRLGTVDKGLQMGVPVSKITEVLKLKAGKWGFK